MLPGRAFPQTSEARLTRTYAYVATGSCWEAMTCNH
jgi:hypothetical protein